MAKHKMIPAYRQKAGTTQVRRTAIFHIWERCIAHADDPEHPDQVTSYSLQVIG
jgi:hypothetical protein